MIIISVCSAEALVQRLGPKLCHNIWNSVPVEGLVESDDVVLSLVCAAFQNLEAWTDAKAGKNREL